MEQTLTLRPIGIVRAGGGAFVIEIDPAHRAGLSGLAGFSHVQILWWFSGCDNPAARGTRTVPKPYKKAPDRLGVFATRSPERPNPLALSCAALTFVDVEGGRVGLAYLDADDGSPVLDLKPYTPSLDRVERPAVPAWCAHWPHSVETSGDFNWEEEFLF